MDLPMTISLNLRPSGSLLPDEPTEPIHGEPAKNPVPAGILGVGTAVTEQSYSQQDLLELLQITDSKVRSVFLNSAIQRRFLTLPAPNTDGHYEAEKQGELLDKHKRLALDMGARAVAAALKDSGTVLSDVDYLCCVTTTGFLTPGLSALLIKDLGLDPSCGRLDVVGMGCNAGLNALNAVSGWCTGHPGQVALMVCMEACSAAYVFDSTMRTAVVNSLFGDGAAAIVVTADPTGAIAPGGGAEPDTPGTPRLLSFASRLITVASDAMRYDWDDVQGRFSFYLDPDIPYVVGANVDPVIDRLLSGTGLRRSDISHWLVHSGGKKVIDAVRVNLGLTRHELRHTSEVLRDFGNLSSGSFLFSYQRLLAEQVVRAGDYGVMVTMGPGSTIETALLQW
jgi:predicted naringenin-chalcone synthase